MQDYSLLKIFCVLLDNKKDLFRLSQMKKLISGIENFRKYHKQQYCQKFARLVAVHNPDALLIACCDSRVVPNVFASTDPGDVFVVRNIGNIVPPYKHAEVADYSTYAAIEYSLTNLAVKDIVVCGHSECGAMQALLANNNSESAMNQWLQYAQASYNRFNKEKSGLESIEDAVNKLSQINVLQQIEHLKTYPLVAQALTDGALKIHGWWFDLSTADVFYYNEQSNGYLLVGK